MKAYVQKTLARLTRHHHDGLSSHLAMDLDPAGETLILRDAQHLQLHGAHGWTVHALAGAVWITQDGDIRDVVLQAGDSFVLDRDGPALFSALREARICLVRDTGRRTLRQPVAAPAERVSAGRAVLA